MTDAGLEQIKTKKRSYIVENLSTLIAITTVVLAVCATLASLRPPDITIRWFWLRRGFGSVGSLSGQKHQGNGKSTAVG